MADLPVAPVAHADLHEVQAAEQLPVRLQLTQTVLTLCLSPSCVKVYQTWK